MAGKPDFAQTIADAYATTGPALELGQGVLDGQLVHEAEVKVALSMANRHGLIAGATGTGKTRTLQVLTEQLSAAGVSVFVADVKGDVSGLSDPGPGRRPGGQARRRPRHPLHAERLSGRVPQPRRHRARRAGAGHRDRLRPAAARRRSSRRTRRRSRASGSSRATPTRRACRSSTSPTCGRCSPSSTPTRARPS